MSEDTAALEKYLAAQKKAKEAKRQELEEKTASIKAQATAHNSFLKHKRYFKNFENIQAKRQGKVPDNPLEGASLEFPQLTKVELMYRIFLAQDAKLSDRSKAKKLGLSVDGWRSWKREAIRRGAIKESEIKTRKFYKNEAKEKALLTGEYRRKVEQKGSGLVQVPFSALKHLDIVPGNYVRIKLDPENKCLILTKEPVTGEEMETLQIRNEIMRDFESYDLEEIRTAFFDDENIQKMEDPIALKAYISGKYFS